MFNKSLIAVAFLAIVCGVSALDSVRDYRGSAEYRPIMEVVPGDGDNFGIRLTSVFPMNGFSDFQRELQSVVGMGQKRSGCEHHVSNYACTNPVQWDLQECGSNGTAMSWEYDFVHESGHDDYSIVEQTLSTSLHEMKADCPMQTDSAGGGSILVAVMLQSPDGVNRLAAKVWKLDLVFNSRTIATAVMWAEDISGNSLLEISIDSELDLMVDLTSDVSRDFYTYFVGETVLVRHKILTTAHYEAYPISAWISPFENPSEASQYFWDANETVQEDQVVPLNFRYVQERTNMLEIWFCFDAPVDCLDCFIHSLANVEIVNDGESLSTEHHDRRLAGPRDDRRVGMDAIKRMLMDADSLQSDVQRFQVLEGQAPSADNAAAAGAATATGGFTFGSAAVGCIAGVLVVAAALLRKHKKAQNTQASKIQPQIVSVGAPAPPCCDEKEEVRGPESA